MSYVAYWGVEANNFGDVLNRNLLDHFNISFTHSIDPNNSNLFAIGSVARLAKLNKSVIMGSGAIRRNETYNPKADWKFVRGPLTRDILIRSGGYCDPIYCDAGLFLPELVEESKKEYEVGIVPHYANFNTVVSQYPNHKIINVNNTDPLKVAQEITKCKKIISSSLHGIICAHAYGIPAAHVDFGKIHGDGTKFEDYYKSVGLEHQTSTVNNPIYTDIKTMPDLATISDIFKSINMEKL